MADSGADKELRWPSVTKDAEETLAVTLSAFALCAIYWEANEQWDPGEFVWPSKPNGFVAECTSIISGRSAAKEPRWPADIGEGATITDGSVTWTLRVPTLDMGIQPLSDPQGVPPADISTQGVVVSESTKILCDYVGGIEGKSFEIKFTFNIAGRLRVGRQIVYVAEK